MKKLSIYILLTLTIVLSFHTSGVHASVKGGNTGLFLPKNEFGELIKITGSTKHPIEDIEEQIQAKEMPRRLKIEMINDLKTVSILYSDEIIKFKDLKKQLNLVLSERIEKTITDSDGKIKTIVEVKYTLKETDNNLGLSFYGINFKVGNGQNDLDETYIAAYTSSNPENKAVIYFSHWINKMSQDQLLRLVLEEQGHRLTYLKAKKHNERFVTGWANLIAEYLEDKISQNDFFNYLDRENLKLESQTGLEGISQMTTGGQIYADITSLLESDDIDLYGQQPTDKDTRTYRARGKKYVLQAKSQALGDYAVFNQKPFQTINILSYINTVEYNLIKETLDFHKNNNVPFTIPLRIFLQNELIENPAIGLLEQKSSIQSINFRPSKENLETLSSQFKTLTSGHPFLMFNNNSYIFKFKKMAIFSKKVKKRTLEVLNEMVKVLSEIKKKNINQYEIIEKLQFNIDLSLTQEESFTAKINGSSNCYDSSGNYIDNNTTLEQLLDHYDAIRYYNDIPRCPLYIEIEINPLAPKDVSDQIKKAFSISKKYLKHYSNKKNKVLKTKKIKSFKKKIQKLYDIELDTSSELELSMPELNKRIKFILSQKNILNTFSCISNQFRKHAPESMFGTNPDPMVFFIRKTSRVSRFHWRLPSTNQPSSLFLNFPSNIVENKSNWKKINNQIGKHGILNPNILYNIWGSKWYPGYFNSATWNPKSTQTIKLIKGSKKDNTISNELGSHGDKFWLSFYKKTLKICK